MSKRKKRLKTLQPSILLYCEGECEVDYFNSLKKDRYGKLPVAIKPKLPRKQDYKQIIKEVDTVFNDKSIPPPKYVFIVLDLDTIFDQGDYDDYCQRRDNLIEKRGKNRVFFIESRPCFEQWFLLHFTCSDRPYNCDRLINKLRQFLEDYCKKRRYRKSVYDLTKHDLQTAMLNAKIILTRPRASKAAFSYTKVYEMIGKIDELEKQYQNSKL